MFLNRLFEVPKKDSTKARLVLDVSPLNLYIPTHRFRMTTLATVRETLPPNCYMASIDLKDAYWHVPIAKAFRPFLAFSAGHSILQFRVLPFGINLAPRVFTKLLQPIHTILTRKGVTLLMYLDDWLIYAPSSNQCVEMIETTLDLGARMGLAFNLKKSQLTPSQSIQWLGISWDSSTSTMALSKDNQNRCRKQVHKALQASTFSRRNWETLMGSLNHACVVVPLGRLRTRRLLHEGAKTFRGQDRDAQIPFPGQLQNLIKWWSPSHRLAQASKWTTPPPFLSLTTDASNTGWGYQSSQGHQGHGTWLPHESRWHINAKELLAVWKAIEAEHDLRNGVIHVVSDNTTTVACLNKQGSLKSARLLELSETILEEAHKRNLLIKASHLAGDLNTWADALSRGSANTIEWSLTPTCFDSICKWAGTPEIDLFASHTNHQLPLFLSRSEVTPAGGPNALLTSWNRWNFLYLFPPPATGILLAVARRLENYRGRALLVAPHWETQPWFPRLLALNPALLPLPQDAILQEPASQLMTSLRLTAWAFSLSH